VLITLWLVAAGLFWVAAVGEGRAASADNL
jgi:hypothetical protein